MSEKRYLIVRRDGRMYAGMDKLTLCARFTTDLQQARRYGDRMYASTVRSMLPTNLHAETAIAEETAHKEWLKSQLNITV